MEGFDYLKSKNYSKALECYSDALKQKPPNSWQILINIGNCHSGLGKYEAAIADFQRSIEIGGLHGSQCINMADAFQKLGQQQKALSWLKLACSVDPAEAADPHVQDVIKKLQDFPGGSPNSPDYLTSLDYFKGWPKAAMPLKVYVRQNIQLPDFYPAFIETIRDSLDQWCKATGNTVSYKFVNSASSANLVCDYTDRKELVSSEHELGIDGNTEMLVKQDRSPGLVNIVVLVKDGPGAQTFRKRAIITQCCLHEVGHALGMHGHSPNTHDVMFPDLTPVEAAKLSQRDQNTIRKIYGP